MLKNIFNKLSPICFLPNGELICYKEGYLYLLDDCKVITKFLIFNSIFERIFSKNRILNRLLRLGIRSAIYINNQCIVLSTGNKIYEFNISNKKLSLAFELKNNIRPLYFSSIRGIDGFEDMIIFGEYFSNPNKIPVNIYKRISCDKWEIVYTFSEGKINHIHNIIPDPFRKCLWIFTGDFDVAAAIWKVTNNFNTVDCVFNNNQNFRACIAFPLKEGLLYATDSPFIQNYIYLLKDDLSVEKIHKIDGSCIYGCKIGNNYVFSSTVEPDGRKQTLFKLIFSKKLGSGIKDNFVRLYKGNLNEGFKIIFKEQKDFLPFIFQFGAFKFPAGENINEKIYFQPIATKKNDQNLIVIDM